MTRHDISECLPFWDSLSAKSRQRLRENAIFRRYKPGENVIFKTVKKDGIVFVLEGKLRVYLSSGTGREITLFKLPKGVFKPLVYVRPNGGVGGGGSEKPFGVQIHGGDLGICASEVD